MTERETARFTVSLSGGTSTANVMVSYTVGGTAKAPGDYTAPSGSLTIQSGESSGTISIQTNTDNVIEPDETLVVTLTDAQTANGTAGVGSPEVGDDRDPGSGVPLLQPGEPDAVAGRGTRLGGERAGGGELAHGGGRAGRSAGGIRGSRRTDRALPGGCWRTSGRCRMAATTWEGAGRLLLPGAAELA